MSRTNKLYPRCHLEFTPTCVLSFTGTTIPLATNVSSHVAKYSKAAPSLFRALNGPFANLPLPSSTKRQALCAVIKGFISASTVYYANILSLLHPFVNTLLKKHGGLFFQKGGFNLKNPLFYF